MFLKRIAQAALAFTALTTFFGAPAVSHAAVQPITDYLGVDASGGCPLYGEVRICSGEVPSFDGTTLDVDLTVPANADPRDSLRHPLMIMLHGFSADKHYWEANSDEGDARDLYHWNNRWFARHGYYVLTYTARGFRTDPPEGDRPPTPSGSSAGLPNGTIRLKSREVEIRDTQWLAALVADSFDVDPRKVAVTGNSYGGGESWLQASQSTWSFPAEHAAQMDPGATLPVLELQAAIPKYGWTDLAYSLAPNGHPGGPEPSIYESAQGRATSPAGEGNPIGVPKISYITGFYALGTTDGIFENGSSTTPNSEGPINVNAWTARVEEGDPYDVAGAEDPVVRQIRRGLTEYRGSYYQDEGWQSQVAGRKVAIFAIQGWTDDLFPAVESFRQFKYLKRLDPQWPVALALADVGHPRAQNKPSTWHRLNNQAWQFLQSHIHGSHEQQTTVFSEPTICPPDPNQDAAQQLTATTPEGLSAGALTINYARSETLAFAGGTADPDGFATDPVLGFVTDPEDICRESTAPQWPGRYTAVSQPTTEHSVYVGLGQVKVPYVLLGGTTATLNARVWDVGPSGEARLITRGTYRFSVPAYDSATGTLRLPLFGDHWPIRVGHRIRLDLAPVDEPTFQRSKVPSAIQLGRPTLTLPTREAGTKTLPGS